MSVLGIDPGTRKAGFAVVGRSGDVLALGVEPVGTFGDRIALLVPEYAVEAIALGRGTNAAAIGTIVGSFGLPVHLVDETETTLRARALYFEDHPPKGWRRLVPLGLLVPPRPIDDYAALLIARRYLGVG
ncbi:MAG: pre-16S rRNA-processing nuclease YqgF [Candidatus Eremiobacteraeota bacterium]|nr:pre-16S rRNA-processing nuclease YqgF [Candidatus Eremiobacteraeota bacterium]MDQ6933637.1 pre-16S rRNA-processing nuclease YqgF [Candidatus Eremiobacteraeota bacterium]